IDSSKNALKVAKINAAAYQIKNIKFFSSNLFANIPKEEKFNIIVSNPPYISATEYKDLAVSVKKQPRKALVAKNNGYYFYQEIFRQVGFFSTKKFLLVVEIGHQQVETIIKLVINYFPRGKVSVFPDYSGNIRVIALNGRAVAFQATDGDRKDLNIKFAKDETIDGYEFKKEKEYKITIENKEEDVDLEHDAALPEGTFKGKIKAPKKSDSDTDTEKDVELVEKELDVNTGELQKNLEVLLKERKDLLVLEVDAEKFRELAQKPEFACGGVVQLVEHRPSDPIVVGSSPATSAKKAQIQRNCGKTPPCHGNEKINPVPEVRITIKDSKNIPIKNFSELTRERAKNKVEVFIDFFVEKTNTRIEDDELIAQYNLKARGSEAAYLHNKKEALTKHLCEKLLANSAKSHVVHKEEINNESGNDELECNIVKFPIDNSDGTQKDEIVIKIRKKGAPSIQDVEVQIENITLVPNFNLPRRVDEVITFSSPSKSPKPF
ncbi:4279_t:CDS:2, partial [Funneliformis geosporum]